MLVKAFDDSVRCNGFREELAGLQKTLRVYIRMLSDVAGVENLTQLEDKERRTIISTIMT